MDDGGSDLSVSSAERLNITTGVSHSARQQNGTAVRTGENLPVSGKTAVIFFSVKTLTLIPHGQFLVTLTGVSD